MVTLRLKSFRFMFALACMFGCVQSQAVPASRDACALVTRGDVASAVGKGAVAQGRLRRYTGEQSSQCQYETEAGNVVVALNPDDGDRQFAAILASYGALQTVTGIGDAAAYSKHYGTLAIRKGHTSLLLTLIMPDEKRGQSIIMALGRRVGPKLR